MKKRIMGIFFVGLVFLTYINPAQAKWWIFGKTEDIPEIVNLFVGGVDVTNMESRGLFLDASNLEAGGVVIKGFVAPGEAPAAVVKISLDGGGNWEDINIQQNSFVHQFEPVEGQEYHLQFKVMDTLGKESDVRDIRPFTLIYRNVSLNEVANEILREAAQAYLNKNLSKFMSFVSDSFTGDIFALENALQSDFRLYDTTSLDLTLQQITKTGDQVKIIIEYNWQGVEKSTGEIIDSERGTTGYTLKQEQGGYHIITMDDPIIFGISRASDFSTGGLNPPSPNLGAQDTLTSLTIFSSEVHDSFGFNFSSGQEVTSNYDIFLSSSDLVAGSGDAGIQVVASSGSLSDHTTVPASGYSSSLGSSEFGAGYIIAVRGEDGTFSIFRITADSRPNEIHFDYKHQPDGTTNVR